MLRKLKVKFVIINMTIVVIMLGVIFCLMYYFTGKNLERESMRTMEIIAMNPMQRDTPIKHRQNIQLPYFSVVVSQSGESVQVGGGFFDTSDREQLNALLQKADKVSGQTGVLKEENLRFSRWNRQWGQCIVFVDMTVEKSILHNMIRNFLLIGGVAFCSFLGISILLAQWAVNPVEEAWLQQKQFVADASHELKTPLTVIMTDAELLQETNCTEGERGRLSGGILSMSRQMRGLVESLLELARIDAGNVEQAFCEVSFSEIALETVMVFEPIFFEKGLALNSDIMSDIWGAGIPAQLSRLVSILLDNAQKYSSPGGETVISLKRIGHKKCLLTVSNQGVPISQADLKHIFKRFYRADKARALNNSYGLGLSIAQGIVETHHGRIWAESAEGTNRFYVELPVK